MARMIKSTNTITRGIKIITVFENGTSSFKSYKVGDEVTDLRYVVNGEVQTITGRLSQVNYSAAAALTYSSKDPKDVLAKDMILTNIVVDASTTYNSKVLTIPVKEILEFEDEENVIRMICEPFLVCDMKLNYSDYHVSYASIEVGDLFNNVKVIDPSKQAEYTGKFEIVGFDYTKVLTLLQFKGIIFKNTKTGEIIVAPFENILTLNEIAKYEVEDSEGLIVVLGELQDGGSITISNEVDTSNGKPISIHQNDVELTLNADVVCDGSNNSGIRITSGSTVLEGTGKVKTTTPYSKSNASGVIGITGNGELTINGVGISSIIEDDPVNKGQFGICLYDDAKLTINSGDFEAGWYCVSGNGAKTSADSEIVINGGTFRSASDYVIYHPHPGKLTINSGIFTGGAGALAANAGTIVINGGSFTTTGTGDTGDASDGTGHLGNAAINLNARYGDITCLITNGIFNTETEDAIMIAVGTAHTVTIQITGGNFSKRPNDEWVPEGYIISDEPNVRGYYTVSRDFAYWLNK